MSGHDLSNISYTGQKDHSETIVALVVSKWNDGITNTLYEGAVSTLVEAGVKKENIHRYDVPGSYELPLGARMAAESSNHDRPSAIICLGCVIQGETRHFEFISNAVSNGIMQLGLMLKMPVIFGVLTPDTDEQATDRAGGKYGNKGEEAAVAALEMIDLKKGTAKEKGKLGF